MAYRIAPRFYSEMQEQLKSFLIATAQFFVHLGTIAYFTCKAFEARNQDRADYRGQ